MHFPPGGKNQEENGKKQVTGYRSSPKRAWSTRMRSGKAKWRGGGKKQCSRLERGRGGESQGIGVIVQPAVNCVGTEWRTVVKILKDFIVPTTDKLNNYLVEGGEGYQYQDESYIDNEVGLLLSPTRKRNN